MRKFSQMKAWLKQVLDGTPFSEFTVEPGPMLADTPGPYVLATLYGGPGEDVDGAMDDVSWQIRVVGPQNDYETAEDAAEMIDLAMLGHHSSHIAGVWVSGIRRVGGAPAPLMRDEAERTHFVCSYVASVELALPH